VLGAVSSLNAGYAYCGLYERDDEYRPVHEVEPTVRLGLRVLLLCFLLLVHLMIVRLAVMLPTHKLLYLFR
jgi:hypothetical protein